MPPDQRLESADKARFGHMHSAATAAIRFVVGRRRTDLDTDEMLRRAVVNAIQEIGEAAARTSNAGRSMVPEVPWGQVVQMRHVLVHVYWGVDLDLVWKTCLEDLPVLVSAISRVLNEG